MRRVTLPKLGTFDAWRQAARGLLAAGVAPEEVLWQRGGGEADLFSAEAPAAAGRATATVPKAFVSLAETVTWHRDPERFARLYGMLCALAAGQARLDDRGDGRVAKLEAMAKEVRRDLHKMHAFVRFREIGSKGAERRSFAAWFEPTNYIMEPAAPFFVRRFGDMDWAIYTPDLSAHYEAGSLRFDEGAARPDLPEDATEDLWRTYFRNIFNPNRVKLKAMRAEMPKKYWKNMPETALIPELVAGAAARARGMAEAAATEAPARAARISERLGTMTERPQTPEDFDHLKDAVDGCRRCPLWTNATQGVPGEGPRDAEVMFVGEQPGDQEDLAGKPFVGPAGQLFDRMLGEAGIDRSRAYVTNAVKHFKFTPRGKRRLHQSPERDEISHCRWWLDLERETVKPKLIVAMGGTALESLTGDRTGILKRRGGIEQAADGTPVLVTVHPSFLLRIPDAARKAEESRLFLDDLRAAARFLAA